MGQEQEKQLEQLTKAARILAVLALQSDRYNLDSEFSNAVDHVLFLSEMIGKCPACGSCNVRWDDDLELWYCPDCKEHSRELGYE